MAWLDGFNKRIKLTVDSSKVNEDLTHFPVAVILSSTHGSEVFTELDSDSNRLKLAFTKDDGITELYGEIEQFDCVNSKAVYHVSKSDWTIVSGTNTDFYMYYDSSHADNTNYIGDIGSTSGEHVWDSNFKMVQHMVDDTTSTILDSTSNNNDGTKLSANNPQEVEGGVGKAQDFDGSNDYIDVSNSASIRVQYGTWEAFLQSDSVSPQQKAIFSKDDSNNRAYHINITNNKIRGVFSHDRHQPAADTFISSDDVGTDKTHIVVTSDGSNIKMFLNGGSDSGNPQSWPHTIAQGTKDLYLGKLVWNYSDSYFYAGIVDELRLSDIARSAAWIKATYHTLWDTLLTYGSKEERVCRYCPITIQSSQVSGDASNFPVLLTEDNLPSEIFTIGGEYSANSDGSDIRFSTDSTGVNIIPHEIVTFTKNDDPSNGKAEIYVNVPNIYASEDVTIFIIYNNRSLKSNDFNGEMIIDIGSEGTHDAAHSRASSVIKDGEVYKMWYVGRDASNHDHVIYCDSLDGKSWTNFTLCFSEGAQGVYDDNSIYNVYVIKDGSTYKMWYDGVSGSNVRIIYCTSTNGITWSNYQLSVDINNIGAGYDDKSSKDPCIIREDATHYKMWYQIVSLDFVDYRIAYCTSTDGILWGGHTVVLNSNQYSPFDTQIRCPMVIKHSNAFYSMWCIGRGSDSAFRIIYCTSTNGTAWSNFELFMTKNIEGTYDTSHVNYCNIILEDGIYRTWYSVNDGSNWRIAYCDSIFPNTPSSKWATWDHNYRLVQHMNQDPSGSAPQMIDSTRFCNHGTSQGSMLTEDLVDGKIGKALEFDGDDDYIDCGNDISLQVEMGSTLSSIFKYNFTGGSEPILDTCRNASAYYGIRLMKGSAENLVVSFGDGTGLSSSDRRSKTAATTINHSTLIHTTAVVNGATDMLLYLNGADDNGSYSGTGGAIAYNTENAAIAGGDNSALFDGLIDESRISNIARSSAWIVSQYNNQHLPATFCIEGTSLNYVYDWLFGFDNRIKFSIDHTKIDEDLTHFPVTLSLSSTFCSEVFSDLLSDTNRFKIAFTKDDGITELYGEIEQFDCVNSKAVYHISKNDWIIASGTNTNFYMYYDSSHADNTNYIGDIGSTPGENVWDSNFKMVQHMVDDTTSTILDSTSNNNDGTKLSANNPQEVDAFVGKGQSFTTDYISMGDTLNVGVSDFSITILTTVSQGVGYPGLVSKKPSGNSSVGWVVMLGNNNSYAYLKTSNGSSDKYISVDGVATDTPHLVSFSCDRDGSQYGYLDGVNVTTGSVFTSNLNNTYALLDGKSNDNHYISGIIDEVRISDSARSDAWIKATYDSLFGNLVTKVESGVNAIFFGFNF